VTNGLVVGAGGLKTDGVLSVSGTSTSYFAGGLLVNSVTSTNLFATSTLFINASTTNFFANTTTISGGFFQTGLSTCNADNQTLAYNATTGKFECGDDDSGGVGTTAFTTAATVTDGITTSSLRADGLFIATSTSNMSGLFNVDSTGSMSVSGTLRVFGTSTLSGNLVQSIVQSPTIIGSVSTTDLSGAIAVTVKGKYAYVLADSTLFVIDISNPQYPAVVGSITDNVNIFEASSLVISGDYVYIPGSFTSVLNVIDVSDPARPTIVSQSLPIGAESIAVSGKYAYLVSNANLSTVDISNPKNPVLLSNTVSSTAFNVAQSIYISGKYAYITNGGFLSSVGGLRIVDISNPQVPVVKGAVSSTSLAGAQDVYVSGRYAYVTAKTDDSLRIIDISSSTAPTIVGGLQDSTNLNLPSSVYVSGKYAFVTAEDSLRIIDISSSTLPVMVTGLTSVLGTGDVFIAGKYAYVTAYNALRILDIPGIDAVSANIGALQVNTLSVTDNVVIANDLMVGRGLSVGDGGIRSDGGLTVTDHFLGSGATSTEALVDIRLSTSTDAGAFRGSALRIVTGMPYGSNGTITSSAKLFTIVTSTTSNIEPIFSIDKLGFAQSYRGFISYDTYMGQEFNAEIANTTADAATWGDNASWFVDEGVCAFNVLDNATGEYGGYHRSNNVSAGSQCYLGMGLGAGDLTTFTKVNSLPTFLAKVRPSTSTALFHTWVGFMIDATALVTGAGATTSAAQSPTTEGIYFTNASGTTWSGRVDPAGSVAPTTLACSGATISNTDWALLKIVVESTSTVRFYVDPGMSNGINFTDCGSSSSTLVTSNLGVAAVMMASSTSQMNLEVDYVRVWSDDPVTAGPVNTEQNQSAEVDTRVFDPVTSADIAETYMKIGDGSYEPGDLVAFDEGNSGDNIAVRKTNRRYDDKVMGVITYSPHMVLGSETSSTVRVALTGRVPVKVSFENGPILPGDPLTAASIPGYAMKATKASKIVGYAVEGASNTSTATRGDFGGQILVALSPSTYGGTFEGTVSSTVSGEELLGMLLSQQAGLPAGLAMTEETQLFADRFIAMREIITPRVIADEIFTKKLISFPDEDINVVLDGDSRLVVSGNVAGTSSTIFSLDHEGNAFFAGLLTADRISANQIIGLEVPSSTLPDTLTFEEIVANFASTSPAFAGLSSVGDVSIIGGLSVSMTSTFTGIFAGTVSTTDIQSPVINDLRSMIESLSTTTQFAFGEFTSSTDSQALRISALEESLVSSTERLSQLAGLFGTGLLFDAPVTAAQGLRVSTISALEGADSLSFTDDTIFFGRPYFTSDTGGFAVISSGDREVEITFDREYLGTPIVQASITFDTTSTGAMSTSTLEEYIFGGDIRYVILNVSSKGFVIRLNHAASVDVTFNWLAFAIQNPKLFESVTTTTALEPALPPSEDPGEGEPPPEEPIVEVPPEETPPAESPPEEQLPPDGGAPDVPPAESPPPSEGTP
ncbi:MAG TPA: hypothetical protein PK295_03445, partial [Candidatus Magasanikbacteria bacterium]|nr:hypothetical protein [Candidatus Magasanikbacteria bacterium]